MAMQWSANATKHAHITEIKGPATLGNNQDYESQICQYLDCANKCQRFDLATTVCDVDVDFPSSNIKPHTNDDDDDNDDDNPTASPEPPRDNFQIVNTTHALLLAITPTMQLTGTTRVIGDYFMLATMLLQGLYPRAPLPLRTFVGAKMAIHLSHDPSFSRMSVNETAKKFKLPDLCGTLVDYINHGSVGGIYTISSPRMAGGTMVLPTDTIEVWNKV